MSNYGKIDLLWYDGCVVPMFWACGVTSQFTSQAAKPSLMITHTPAHGFVGRSILFALIHWILMKCLSIHIDMAGALVTRSDAITWMCLKVCMFAIVRMLKELRGGEKRRGTTNRHNVYGTVGFGLAEQAFICSLVVLRVL